MRVKICGITNLEDALLAIHAGADALGFVFYPESPRYITPTDAKKIIEKLPPFVDKVALFVNETPEFIRSMCLETGCTLAQIHFDVEKDFFTQVNFPSLRVIRAQKREDIFEYADEYRLVDAYCESFGGSGKRLNIEWFEGIDCSKIILAGGLNPENVADLKPYGFYGVDVSSGVEASYGKKDPQRVASFIKKAKA
ncbi:MAG: N-(5'-phosphoribosyl)anthranilate isomerase [Sulfuricurvum sp. GWF2_44_89]|uniref:N-(5'-phosphoribosyl)anthranilate isomerase n=1 Tax=Sulfuricurvum kujiense TaxID=148813 RepID=A0A2D3WFP9_9BACT|nr:MULTISPECIES: phosphoribosylanthranilate isomerase [Sulfuricurvum]OHD77093.1 MAG: N-(5'-phosphoribosyl)anthranilate isomerase [Sulfuricurvum sp. GWF2_44_89]OHD95655.1 MAG: N-(5'-phosphoribosyl)anthranilate isomerase [Sulfuricurvum sp. RIFOXYD12_FULL_44_77]OHD99509.1 MAG: N-(5'-phosphoribosyl)anthranilate isomerase [Sulfuricurvum sp. RIFOXYD2_FULL_44_160]DAB37567.1 MAG TPA: N-(5'-phosphoribosyl)anthranilate isomerase [Sulfuricurvum kujiense]